MDPSDLALFELLAAWAAFSLFRLACHAKRFAKAVDELNELAQKGRNR